MAILYRSDSNPLMGPCNKCHPDGATKHSQNVFLTHGRLQSHPNKIAHEPFYSLLFMARFNLINIKIS
jgi:hypothetical protein